MQGIEPSALTIALPLVSFMPAEQNVPMRCITTPSVWVSTCE